MLTIKHIDTEGTETLIEAERVEKVQTGDRFTDGIYLDRDQSVGRDQDGEMVFERPRSFRHVIRFADARSTNDTTPMVYVMNRFGSTVATYHL